MDISRFFIDRPRFAGVISIFIFLLGLLAIIQLPVSEYPEVSPPQIEMIRPRAPHRPSQPSRSAAPRCRFRAIARSAP